MDNKNKISVHEVAARLGISVEEVEKLAQQGILHPLKLPDTTTVYSTKEIANISSSPSSTISEEAAKIGIQIQRQTVSSLSSVRKVVLAAGGGFLCFLGLAVVFAVLFSFFPLRTANWLGLTTKPESLSFQKANLATDSKVLGAQTAAVPTIKKPSWLQTTLSPVRAVSLGIVKFANPDAYIQIAKETILDANDVLAIDNGIISPAVPLRIPNSSSLDVTTSELIANLNSQYLQGRKPGTNIGDIAIVGLNGPGQGGGNIINGLSNGGLSLLNRSSLANLGVTSLTGTPNQVIVSGLTGAVNLSLPQNIHTGAVPTFGGLILSAAPIFSSLANCGGLSTNSSGVVECNGTTSTALFTDTTPGNLVDGTLVPTDTIELFNDPLKPSITPSSPTQTILVSVHARFTNTGRASGVAVRLVRSIGSPANCSTSGQVGDILSAFMNRYSTANATGTLLDSPATTGKVFYTVCSSASSKFFNLPTSNRIDVTIIKLNT